MGSLQTAGNRRVELDLPDRADDHPLEEFRDDARIAKSTSRGSRIILLVLLVLGLGIATSFLGFAITRLSASSSSSASSPTQKRTHGTLRPVETPPPGITEDFEGAITEWNQWGSDLEGKELGGAFGKFVTLSANGKRLAVTSTAAEATSVAFFELETDGTATSLYEVNHQQDYFGNVQPPYYATVSGNGDYFVVAAVNDGVETTFTHQIQFLDISDGATKRPGLYLNGLYDTYYGRPIAISHTAQYIVVGIDGWQVGGKSRVQVFNDTNDGWKQVGNDLTGEGAFSEFGNTVCISSNGAVVAVADRSKFRVFEWTSGEWKRMGGNETDARTHGVERIALSSDGKTIATAGSGIRVYRFEANSQWKQLGDTIEADTDYGYYNLDRVALSGDGLTLATGTNNADSADVSGQVVGYVRVYKLLDGQWQQIGERIDGVKSSETFGASLSLSNDGSRLAVAAPGNEGHSATVGAVRVYDLVA